MTILRKKEQLISLIKTGSIATLSVNFSNDKFEVILALFIDGLVVIYNGVFIIAKSAFDQ